MTDYSPEWFEQNRAAFVAGTLDPADEAAYRARLAVDAAERAAVAEEIARLGWISMGPGPVTPRPGFTRDVLRRVIPPQQSSRVNLLPWAIAASALVGAGGTWWSGTQERAALRSSLAAARTTVQSMRTELAAVTDTLSVIRRTGRVLHTQVKMNGTVGTLTILDDPVSHRWHVVVSGLPPAPRGEQYQFFFLCEDGMVRAATVRPAKVGGAQLTLGMPSHGGRVLGAALMMEAEEPGEGSTASMTLAKVMLD